MQSVIYRAGWKLLDILFPPSCGGCGQWGEKYCPECLENTQLLQKPICQICGDSLENSREVICVRCQSAEIAFAAVRSWAYYLDPLQNAIQRLKYKRDVGLASALAKPLAALLADLPWRIDAVIPVPLDPGRLRDRGYNQSALLARPLSWEFRLEYLPRVVRRVRPTRQQVGLSREERVANMQNAFAADKALAAGRSFLLIDDVITTGSTLNSCARSLMNAGAEAVYGITLARSPHL